MDCQLVGNVKELLLVLSVKWIYLNSDQALFQ